MQLTFACLVELAAVEARADDVQLCLSESTLHAEYKAIVEVGWIVTPILVDDERAGDGAQLEQAMPVLVRSRQSRRFQGEDRANLPHRYIADQGLEVHAVACCGARVSEIAVEDPDLLLAPAERFGLVHQVVLPLCALLIDADLRQGRLAYVNACLPRQVSFGDFGHHAHRAPPDWTAGRRRQDRTQPCRRGWRLPW